MKAESSSTPGRQRGAFSARVVVVMVAVAVTAFIAFLVLSAFANDLRKPAPGDPHAESKSAVGFAGLVALARMEGRTVTLHRGELSEYADSDVTVVLTPKLGAELPWQGFGDAWVDKLVVLPKWLTAPDDKAPGWVTRVGLAPTDSIAHIFSEWPFEITVTQDQSGGPLTLKEGEINGEFEASDAGQIDRLQTISGEHILPVLVDDKGRIVLGRVQVEMSTDDVDAISGNFWILAEPDLLNTHGLASEQTARAGLALIDRIASHETPLVFDLSLHGLARSRNLLRLLFLPPFLPAVLCLCLAGGLMALRGALGGGVKRPSARELAMGKTVLIENSALLFSLTGRDVRMGSRYAELTRSLALAALGVRPGVGEARSSEALDAATRKTPSAPSYSSLLSESGAAKTPNGLLRAARRLYEWKQELVRESRRR